jgi:hypothetical protein
VVVNDRVERLFWPCRCFFPYERHETRLRAHVLNAAMHRTNAANTATFNTASIMLPSTEGRLPFEVLICRKLEIFPAQPLRSIAIGAPEEGAPAICGGERSPSEP